MSTPAFRGVVALEWNRHRDEIRRRVDAALVAIVQAAAATACPFPVTLRWNRDYRAVTVTAGGVLLARSTEDDAVVRRGDATEVARHLGLCAAINYRALPHEPVPANITLGEN